MKFNEVFPRNRKTAQSNKKGLLFFETMILKGITNYSLKLEKVFSQQPMPFKSNASLDSNASQYSEAIKACKKFASPINR